MTDKYMYMSKGKSIKLKEKETEVPEKTLDDQVNQVNQVNQESNVEKDETGNDEQRSQEDDYVPMGPDYVIRQQQLANFQMLCQFFVHREKNMANIVDDVRVSVDCLTKAILHMNKNLEKLCATIAPNSAHSNGSKGIPPL